MLLQAFANTGQAVQHVWCKHVHNERSCLTPLCFFSSQLTDGGKAVKANISVGDIILSINGVSTDSMTHLEAQNKIKACTGNLSLTLQR